MRGLLKDSTAAELAQAARADGREVLLEHEGYALLGRLGIRTPRHLLVHGTGELSQAELDQLGTARVVLKVVSPEVQHKSELGGVRILPAALETVERAIAEMEAALAGRELRGFLLVEFVPHDAGVADQLLLGMRWTEDFGPVVTLGPGGVEAEFWASALRPGEELALLGADQVDDRTVDRALETASVSRLATREWRGAPPRIPLTELRALVQRFQAFAAEAAEAGFAELEVNPLVIGPEGPVALDLLAKLSSERATQAPARPLRRLADLLRPRSIAVMGVSARPNPGHIIVRNTLAAGFDPQRLWILKPDCDTLLGCPCVPDLASLPEPVDLLILAVSAAQVPELVEQVVRGQRAQSLIVIPGGLGEHSASGGLAQRLQGALVGAREGSWGGPVLNGANCLGIRSRPGRYDTLFIPGHKLPVPEAPEAPVALLSQSGAFAVARASKLSRLNPRYIVTAGNQLDLTIGDYLEHLADDEEVQVYACYVEGFRPGDGARFLRAARRILASGRSVVLYRAGRTAAGASASASHTASMAGDYAVTRELCRHEGVVVADSLADFEELVQLFTAFADRPLGGRRLGAMSNAGFECVAMADNLRGFQLASFTEATRAGLTSLLEQCRLQGIVEVNHPLDTTPMMPDAPFAGAAELLLADPGVDLGLVGCVPLTAAMNTLAAGDHHEDLSRPDSVAALLVELWRRGSKPWAAVVDSGELYDPLAARLLDGGVPTFRTADRALRLLELYARAKGL